MTSNQMTADNGFTAEELEEYNYWVGMRQALERLEANPDFKKVILEGYFKDRAVNAVSALSSQYVRKSGTRGELMEELNAISQLQQHFIIIKSMGAEAPDDEFDDDEE